MSIFMVSEQCPTPEALCFGDYCMDKFTLAPTSLLALAVGLYVGLFRLRSTPVYPSRWLYSFCFVGFGIMMTSASILHCFIHDKAAPDEPAWRSLLRLIFGVIDCGLTSNIGVTFLFAGCADIRLINPKTKCTKIMYALSIAAVFAAWLICFISFEGNLFGILYFGIVGLTCGLYLVTQVLLFSFTDALSDAEQLSDLEQYPPPRNLCCCRNRIPNPRIITFRARVALVIGGLAGGIGFWAVSPFGSPVYCSMVGYDVAIYFGPEFVWFILSDVSMWCLGTFLWLTYGRRLKVIHELD